MKKQIIIIIICFSNVLSSQSEQPLPYAEIPIYSDTYTAGTMVARMVDALGFRFHWATDDLSDKDLIFKPNEQGRTTAETIKHIYDLSKIIVNSTLKQPNNRATEDLSYKEMRAKTLNNLKMAADILRESDDISNFKIIFGELEIPFWNQVNGPIADGIWHCGQIAVYRRTSGNPINSKINHFTGKVRS